MICHGWPSSSMTMPRLKSPKLILIDALLTLVQWWDESETH